MSLIERHSAAHGAIVAVCHRCGAVHRGVLDRHSLIRSLVHRNSEVGVRKAAVSLQEITVKAGSCDKDYWIVTANEDASAKAFVISQVAIHRLICLAVEGPQVLATGPHAGENIEMVIAG